MVNLHCALDAKGLALMRFSVVATGEIPELILTAQPAKIAPACTDVLAASLPAVYPLGGTIFSDRHYSGRSPWRQAAPRLFWVGAAAVLY
jgi:hypothetical protein